MKDQIEALISKAISDGGNEVAFTVEHPDDLSHGDYATNAALVLAKARGENPKEVAQGIVEKIESENADFIKKIEIAGPGFINFYLEGSLFLNLVKKILKEKENFGRNSMLAKEKTIVEYTDANPFKEFHIGHVMSNAIGESLSRIYEFSGAEVKRACYQGDVGLHVAKAVAQKLRNSENWESINDIAGSYAKGNSLYDTDEEFRGLVVETNKHIYARDSKEINEIYDLGKKISLEYFEGIYETLGTKFDFNFFESEAGSFGKEIVEKNIGKVFEESEGAVVFRAEKFYKKLHTRVFINKEGLPTYEAKELGLAKIKFDSYPYDKSVVITGNEINDYFKVLLCAMTEIFPELASKTVHIGHGMMRLPSGKMSSRTGDVVTAKWLIDEVSEKVREKMRSGHEDLSGDEDLVRAIAVGAIKYSILKQSVGRDIIFDIESATSFEGDSGPYLQYTSARINSLYEKANTAGISPTINDSEDAGELERVVVRFPEVVERANKERSSHFVTTYLIELSSLYNSFYNKNIVIDEKNKDTSAHRLAISVAVSQVIKNGLNLLGIMAPERM